MAEEKSRFSKYIVPIIIIAAFIIVGIYAFAYLQTDAGQRQLTLISEGVKAYNPITLITSQVEETKRAVSWTTETNTSSVKQGVNLKSFMALSKKAAAESSIILKYDLDVNIPSTYTVPTDFNCRIPSTDLTGEIIPPNPIKITSGKEPSVRCKFNEAQTKGLKGPTKIEGGFTFPYTTKNIKLPVYFARPENAEDFFTKYKLDENQPIKAKYSGEPVELAIGVSDENLQPVVVGEDQSYPMIGLAINNRWGGRIKSITAFELSLPEDLTINQELTKNPTQSCPFELTRTEKGRNIYTASSSVLETLTIIENSQTFECWLNINPDMIPSDADYVKKDYTSSISYTYDVLPKVDVVTVE